jgi:hypothetical protein
LFLSGAPLDVVVRLTCEVEQAERNKETITGILSSLCDAFVQLEGELRIESTSESLAVMLFMQGPRGVEGKSFIELIPHEEDKDRLRSIINKSVATSTNADCLHVHMRDAYGSSVLVLLFISGLEGIGTYQSG